MGGLPLHRNPERETIAGNQMIACMINIDGHRPITTGEVLLDSLGYDCCQMSDFGVGEITLPPSVESHIFQTLNFLTDFCEGMAAWYISTFADGPIILISAPSIEMCVRYQIPARRSFILRILSRIIENIGPESTVGIVDCKHDPIIDQVLAAQANYWVHKFSEHHQMPGFFDSLAKPPSRSI